MSESIRTLLKLNSIYILLLLITLAADLSTLSNLLAFFPVFICGLIFFSNVKCIFSSNISYFEFYCIFILIIAGILHIGFAPYPSYSDYLKFLLIFVFYFIGAKGVKFNSNLNMSDFAFPLIIFPFMCFLKYLYGNYFQHQSQDEIFFFSNRNNVIAYTLVSLFVLRAFTSTLKKPILTIVPIILAYNTLGALLAFLMSYASFKVRFSYKTIITISTLLFLVVALSYFDLPIFNRVKVVFMGVAEFFSVYSFSDIKNVGYGEIVSMQDGSGDVSLFFRLKHWGEIIGIIISENSNILTGWGMSASATLTSIHLVPHNDWLRVFFELGLFYFILFLILNIKIFLFLIKVDVILATIFFTVLIYMFSENLINNFLITSLLYYSAGLLEERE